MAGGDGKSPEKGQTIKAEHGSTISQVVQVAGDYYDYGSRPSSQDSTASYKYIPSKSCPQFIGRIHEMDSLMGALRDQQNKPIVAIIGLGGTGKTTLALEALDTCRSEEIFQGIVWASCKTELFVGEDITHLKNPSYSFDVLTNDIIRQCITQDISKIPIEQRRPMVEELLETKRILLVLDNLETIKDREKLIADLFQILGRGKLLVTSRHNIKHERTFTITLRGLSKDDGVTFLHMESDARGLETVVRADRASLETIFKDTGGNPLAMKLVIGQLSRQPMKVVLTALKEASALGPDYQFFCFLFRYSWEMLDMKARMVWVDMSVFPALVGGTVQDVEAISQVAAPDFWPAMDQLVGLSLVDKIGDVGAERFALHPLSQYFIRSDITKEWVGPPES